MGLSPHRYSNCSCDCDLYYKAPTPNPNPKNFEILETQSFGAWTVAKVKYPDATNYEGTKILVYRATLNKLASQKELDPHFCEKGHLSPFARFEPTEAGWKVAIALAQKLSRVG